MWHHSLVVLSLLMPALVAEGAWIAARATARDTLLPDADMVRYNTRERRSEAPSPLSCGHTDPTNITVGGKGARRELER